MRRKFWLILLATLTALCLCLGITACAGGGSSVEGTYYLYENGSLDKSHYYALEGGEWTDGLGESGTYELKDGSIKFYQEFFGENTNWATGTVKDGVLTMTAMGITRTYYKEGREPSSGTQGGNNNTTPTANEYTVTYDANGGAFADEERTFTQTVKDGNKLTAPTSPTRNNYTFAGWAKSKNGSTMWKFDQDTVAENTTLYAQWTQESAVILSVDGASIEGREIFMLVDHDTASVSLSGKVVCSDDSIWRLYSDPEGQREIPTKMVTNLSSGDNEYYIVVNSQNQAQVNVYSLTVHRSYRVSVSYYDGEELLKSVDAYTGEEFTASYTPNIAGYTFNGWRKNGSAFTSEVLWKALSLYADKTANTYNVTLNVNGGDALTESEKTLTYDKTYSLPVPTRTGYSFAGWYSGSTQLTNARGSSLGAWSYASETQLTAHWDANHYAVTLNQNDANAGTVSGDGDHAYDSQVTIKATTNNGYNFLGWYDKNDELVSEQAQYTFKMGFAVSYTAKWDYYTLTTTRNNTSAGTLNKTYTEEKVSVGTKVTLTAKTNKGFTFVGWYKGDEEVSKDLTYQYTMTKENVAFEARWALDPDMADFKFTSSSTTCTITGVNDTTKTEYIIPDYVTEVNRGAFSGCSSVQSMTIPFVGKSRPPQSDYQDTFASIFGFEEFDGASRVKQDMLTSKGGRAWAYYYIPDSLKSVTVTGGEIIYGAFSNCNKLTSVTIGNGVTTIEEYAFEHCSKLTSITVGNDITSIKNYAFTLCYKLLEIWNYSELPITAGESSYGKIAYYAKHVYTTDVESKQTSTQDGYLFYEDENESLLIAYRGEETNLTLPSASPKGKTYAINELAFSDCHYYEADNGLYDYNGLYIKSVVIPDGITSIGDSAFENSSELKSVTIGSNVISIGECAFYCCKLLESVTIGSNVISIGKCAFYNSGLISITISESVTEIGDAAFAQCSKLTNVIWNAKNCVKVGIYKNSNENNTIFHDSSLITVTIGTNVKAIPAYAFYGCSRLTSITIPDSVTSIGEYTFSDCSRLTSITIPDSVTSIGEYTFSDCSGLTSVHITDLSAWCKIDFGGPTANPLYYAHHLYLNNIEITELTIPSDIKAYAFYNCDGLTSVTIGDSVTSLGDYAFYNCDGLTSVTIGDSVTSIGRCAFLWCDGLTSVEFKNPNGWYRTFNSTATSGTALSGLDDKSTAAKYLRENTTEGGYAEYYWKRNAE